MTEVRTASNRLRNWNGTVHYADNGQPACGPVATHSSHLAPSVATVTCKRCIAMYGEDTPGQVDPPAPVEEHVARRAAERAARQAARAAATPHSAYPDMSEVAVGEECAICGEGGCDAEMYDPQAAHRPLMDANSANPLEASIARARAGRAYEGYVHAECGIAAGWEIS